MSNDDGMKVSQDTCLGKEWEIGCPSVNGSWTSLSKMRESCWELMLELSEYPSLSRGSSLGGEFKPNGDSEPDDTCEGAKWNEVNFPFCCPCDSSFGDSISNSFRDKERMVEGGIKPIGRGYFEFGGVAGIIILLLLCELTVPSHSGMDSLSGLSMVSYPRFVHSWGGNLNWIGQKCPIDSWLPKTVTSSNIVLVGYRWHPLCTENTTHISVLQLNYRIK